MGWADGKGLCLMKTCLEKRKHWLVTFRSGKIEAVIDFIPVNNRCRSMVEDVKVIPGEKLVGW